MPAIIWFRQDLRLADNPALSFALEGGDTVIPVYIHAPAEESPWEPGGAARWWLHHSLERLREQLKARGSDLLLRCAADSGAELLSLARETGATRIAWNRRYEPAAMTRDARIKMQLRGAGLQCESFNGALLREPWEVKTKTGTPYQVFTPFWRQLLSLPEPAAPLQAPAALPPPPRWPRTEPLEALRLLPRLRWDAGIAADWEPGSDAGHGLLARFLDERIGDYDRARDRPDMPGTSRMSPYLHAGNLSPREIWHAVRKRHGHREGWRESRFLAEVIWREFAHHLLYHFPETPDKPLRGNYARFAWAQDEAALRAWQRGLTGYPIVDAGMRQLWQTGWMHNRVRMITASFLVKDLLLSWQQGSRWFWDTLVDADLASNTLGWQWSAGCGADAAPYFRIFNPVSQGRKFDPDGAYVRRFVPELAQLPIDWIHEPWNAPADVLARAQVELGRNYPRPIVDHKVARVRALATLAALKS
jgi:deoxyribodipyrimidine photo-lyase